MSTSKIFFSYSRLDSAFALQLAKDIRSSGADIWIDQLDIPAGNHWDAAVEKALATSAVVLVILSPSSTSSTNVMDEVSFALESGKKIIPVLLEDCIAPFRIRRLQRIDFTKDYNVGLTQLLGSFDHTQGENSEKSDSSQQQPEPPKEVVDPGKKAKADGEQESRLWDIACKLNTAAGYEKYLKDSITGEFKPEARLLINQLELEQKADEQETTAWKKTKNENTLLGYQQFLKTYPDRNYKSLAVAAIAELEAFQREEFKKQEARRQEEKRLEDKRKEEERLEAKRQEEKRQEEKREEAKRLEEKRKEEKRIEEQKKAEKRQEELHQEELRKEQKRQEALRKEQEKQEHKKQAALASASSTVGNEAEPSSSSRKFIFIGIGVIMVGLLLWLLIGNSGAKKRDSEAWKTATADQNSISYSGYLSQFPTGQFAKVAQHRLDSLKVRQQVEQDSMAVLTAQHVKDSLALIATAKTTAQATPTPPTKTPPATTPPTTTAKSTAKSKSTATATPAKPVSPYKLGQAYGGGIIYHIENNGFHGLIMSDKDLGVFNYETALKKISKYDAGNSYAWRLPSKDDLMKLYAYQKGQSLLNKKNYWSSTPDKENFYWAINMGDGSTSSFSKSISHVVRAIKSF